MMPNPVDFVKPTVRGRPSIFTVPAGVDPRDTANWTLVHQGQNVICAGMYQAMTQLLMRNFDDWQATTIALGFGGNYNEDGVDQGSRQPPAFTDTAMRKSFFEAPIVQVAPSIEDRFYYIAIIRPEDGNTDNEDLRPYIDELGLLAANGTLLAHYITPADPLDATIATQYAKSTVEWLVIRWEIEFAGAPV